VHRSIDFEGKDSQGKVLKDKTALTERPRFRIVAKGAQGRQRYLMILKPIRKAEKIPDGFLKVSGVLLTGY
jgi:hypothetical protein